MMRIKYLLLFLLLTLLAIIMLNLFKGRPKYKIIEIRDFSCLGMSGFTFKYPVFEKWDVNSQWLVIDNNSCSLFFDKYFIDHPSKEKSVIKEDRGLPRIDVVKQVGVDARIKVKIYRNFNNVEYYQGDCLVNFLIGDSLVTVSLWGVSKRDNFPVNAFFKIIIESFKLANGQASH